MLSYSENTVLNLTPSLLDSIVHDPVTYLCSLQVWALYTVFTTTVAPVLPIWPFAPGTLGPLEYPFPILRMGH